MKGMRDDFSRDLEALVLDGQQLVDMLDPETGDPDTDLRRDIVRHGTKLFDLFLRADTIAETFVAGMKIYELVGALNASGLQDWNDEILESADRDAVEKFVEIVANGQTALNELERRLGVKKGDFDWEDILGAGDGRDG